MPLHFRVSATEKEMRASFSLFSNLDHLFTIWVKLGNWYWNQENLCESELKNDSKWSHYPVCMDIFGQLGKGSGSSGFHFGALMMSAMNSKRTLSALTELHSLGYLCFLVYVTADSPFFFFSFIVLIFHFTKLHLFAVPRLKDCGLSQYKLTFLILKGSFLVAETVDVKLVQISPLFLRLNVPEHFPRFLNL